MGGPTPGSEAVRDRRFKEATVLLPRGAVISVTLVSRFLAPFSDRGSPIQRMHAILSEQGLPCAAA